MSGIEAALRASGVMRIAGVDEAGRGPCAGPLIIAAVILKDSDSPVLARVRDSKALTEKVREELYEVVIDQALSYSIIEIAPEEIDRFGLHKSNLEGMRRAINSLTTPPEYVLTDGYAIEGLAIPNLAVWKGDQVALSISAASILAKVYRDRIMREMDVKYPGYGFAKHKGYATAAHTAALQELGITEIHRKSFANIASLIESTGEVFNSDTAGRTPISFRALLSIYVTSRKFDRCCRGDASCDLFTRARRGDHRHELAHKGGRDRSSREAGRQVVVC